MRIEAITVQLLAAMFAEDARRMHDRLLAGPRGACEPAYTRIMTCRAQETAARAAANARRFAGNIDDNINEGEQHAL